MNHIEQGIYDAHKAVATEELKRREADQVLQALSAKINSIENLRHYAGALLPANTSEYPSGITVNDFATIRADETHGVDVTRYVVREIDAETGDITWVYDLTYTTCISGKTDKVTDNIACPDVLPQNGVRSFYVSGLNNVVVGNNMENSGEISVVLDGSKNIIELFGNFSF
ncbi:MAG: hypothetical protein LBV17_07230 [Treponema sp.]|jgi:hypothetical protein|nr:hypothetical protein [Treponema sp.]